MNTLVRLRTLRAAAQKANPGEPPRLLRVVSCVTASQTQMAAMDIAQRACASGVPMNVELITTGQLTGGYMTQVAETHNVRLVLRHLMMDRRGCEIYIRPLSRYPRLLEKLQARKWMPYCEIAEYVRGLGETAIGYVHENGHHELNPSNTRQRIAPGDLLITIAEHP